MPLTMAQSASNLIVNPQNVTACETYTWGVTGETFTTDTVVTFLNATNDTLFVLKAFADGADGVLVSGCHFGDCHYLAGNFKAAKRMFLVKSILQNMGLEHKRFRMTFVSASEGAKWAVVINDVINTVKEIGPSPIAAERKRRGL